MNIITEVRVSPVKEEVVKAYVTITIANAFVIRHIRILNTTKGILIAMPTRKLPDGSHKDIAHPISQEFRKDMETVIMAAYESEVKKRAAPSAPVAVVA